MKKAVRSSSKGTSSNALQASPAGTVNTVLSTKQETRPLPSASPTPVWSRYVDSRLKQFCMR